MESLCELLKPFDPAHGLPVPLAAIYAANTCTAGEFERESKRLELQSRKAWADSQRRIREDMEAESWVATRGADA